MIDNLLTKEELIEQVQPYELSNDALPAMLITAIKKYTGNANISSLDAVELYNAIEKNPTTVTIKKFSKEHKMYFGLSQYSLLERYVKALK